MPTTLNLDLIKHFEGLRLEAYADPARGWDLPTIGYGTTVYPGGRRVARGDVITQDQAEAALRHHVETMLPALQRIPRWAEMHPRMQAALASFGYNLGAGFYGSTDCLTITTALKASAWDTMRSAFLLYCKAGGKVLPGLLRRRTAEADEWDAGLRELRAAKKPAPPAAAPGEVRLRVPYFSQRDSQVPNMAPRSCFTSSNAMLLETLKPGTLPGTNGDDVYLREVLSRGSSTDPAAQIATLRHHGVEAERRTNLGWADLDAQLRADRPVPIGIFHHGHVSAPTRDDGHWIVVVGRSADGAAYLVHDPYGELDLVNGGYDTTARGDFLRYSKRNLGPRWMADGPGTGWGIIVQRA